MMEVKGVFSIKGGIHIGGKAKRSRSIFTLHEVMF